MPICTISKRILIPETNGQKISDLTWKHPVLALTDGVARLATSDHVSTILFQEIHAL